MTVKVKGVALRPETRVVQVREIGLTFGMTEQKVQKLMVKYEIDSTMLADAIEISREYEGALYKACELIKSQDGDVEVVREIYEICEDLEEASLISISVLLQKFGGETPSDVIDAVKEAHEHSKRKWLASTVLDLLYIAESNESIIFLDQLVDELRKLKR